MLVRAPGTGINGDVPPVAIETEERQTNRVCPRAQQLKQRSPSGFTALSTGTGRRCPNKTLRDGQFRRSGYPSEVGSRRGGSLPCRVKTEPRGWSVRVSASSSGRSVMARKGGVTAFPAGEGTGSTSIASGGFVATSTRVWWRPLHHSPSSGS